MNGEEREQPRWMRLMGGEDALVWWFLGLWIVVITVVLLVSIKEHPISGR